MKRRITFMGQVKFIEFGSRWRKELMPVSVRRGKTNAEIIAEDIKNGGKGKANAAKTFKESISLDRKWSKESEEIVKEGWTKSKNKGTFNELTKRKRSGKTSRNTIRVKNAVKELKTSRFFREKLPKKGTSPRTYKQANRLIDKTVEEFNSAVKAPPNVVNSSNSSTTKTSLLQPKPTSKSSSLLTKAGSIAAKHPGKLALGISAAGIGTAIGLGMYRKMRSDKGKKRGKYKN